MKILKKIGLFVIVVFTVSFINAAIKDIFDIDSDFAAGWFSCGVYYYLATKWSYRF